MSSPFRIVEYRQHKFYNLKTRYEKFTGIIDENFIPESEQSKPKEIVILRIYDWDGNLKQESYNIWYTSSPYKVNKSSFSGYSPFEKGLFGSLKQEFPDLFM